jgi:hypothetical protein
MVRIAANVLWANGASTGCFSSHAFMYLMYLTMCIAANLLRANGALLWV